MLAINENIRKYTTKDPSKASQSKSISNLCDDVETGKLTLPVFQTYVRWPLSKCVELLNFQLSGDAPVSPISINVINDLSIAIPQVSFIERSLIPTSLLISKYSLIDGQQRITCNYKAYTNHEDFKCIVFDLEDGEFKINEKSIEKHQIPVGILYNKNQNVLIEYIKNNEQFKPFEVYQVLTDIRTKFMKYEYTVNYANDLNEEQQKVWFTVLNLAGSRVPENQVFLCDMLVKSVDFYKEYSEPFCKKIKVANIGNYDSIFPKKSIEVSIPLALLNIAYEVVNDKPHNSNYSPLPSDAKGKFMSKLEPSVLREMFDLSLYALDYTIDFININKLDKPDRCDYISYLVGFFMYIIDGKLSDTQKEALIDWYKNVDFSKLDNTSRRNLFTKLIDVRYK